MHSVFTVGVAAFAGFCAAQSTAQAAYPYTIDPNTVTEATRQYWCAQNQAQCPLICLQQPDVTSMTTDDNSCDPEALTYSCVCDNGVVPNITEYSQTLPFFICQAWGNNCVDGCQGDNTCQSKCRQEHPCGAQNPFKGNASTPSSTQSATAMSSGASATRSVPATGFAGSEETGTSSSNQGGAAPGTFMPSAALSMAAVFGSVFFGFALLL